MAAALLSVGMFFLLARLDWDALLEWALSVAVVTSIGLVVATWLAQPSDPDLPEGWLPARLLLSSKAKVFAVVGAVVLGVLGDELFSRM